MRLLYLVFILGVNCLRNLQTDLILTFLKENDVKYCFFLVCWPDFDKVKFSRTMMKEKMDTRIAFLSAKEGSISAAKTDGYSKITYILDLSCGEAFAILLEASKTFKFTLTNSWLMLASPDTALKDVKSLFDTLELRLDMNVKIAIPKCNGSRYDIYEIYDPGLEVDYKLNSLGFFKDRHFSYLIEDKTFFQVRRNMSGVLVRNANVVNFTAELLWKYRNVANYNEHGGLYGLYLYFLFQPFVELLKFRYNTTISYPWFGYSDNGTEGGLGKLLYEKKVDIQIGGGVVTVGRTPYFEPLVAPYMKLKTFFIYRSPGFKKPGAQVLKPLAPEVWYYILVTVVVTIVMIKTAYWVENKFLNSNEVHNFFTSFMTVVAVLTQQGSSTFPQYIGGRIVFLNLLIFSIWLYNYYTSGLVSSLLNSKAQMLTSFRDLYESPLEIGMEDQAYTHLFVMNSKDRYLKELYKKKIYGRHGNRGPNLFFAQEGLEKVRKGGFAFHTMVYTAYPIISSTFDQEAICDLGEIEMLNFIGAMFLSKKSQYKELFVIGFTKLWENGISKKVYDYLIEKRPECRSSLLLSAVGPQELLLVYLIFLAGVFLAIVTMLVEIFYHKIKTKNLRIRNQYRSNRKHYK